MLPQGHQAAKYDSLLSGSHKYLEFKVHWELKKKKEKETIPYETKVWE